MKWNKTQYRVYIMTNYKKSVLYTGVTNNLEQRTIEHYFDRIDKRLLPESIMPSLFYIMNCISILKMRLPVKKK